MSKCILNLRKSSILDRTLSRGLKMIVSSPDDEIRNRNIPDKKRLPVMPKIPSKYEGFKVPKVSRELHRLKGEEMVHNELILKQYGVVITHGCFLGPRHFEMMRMGVGHHIKNKKAFAIYRVPAPHKPVTVRGVGKRMGGGKPSIDHYVTPVRAGRVLFEIGGDILWDEVRPWLSELASKLPAEALAVNQDLLDRLNAEEERLEKANANPYTMEWLIRNNIMDCQRKLSPFDKEFFGKFVYRDRDMNKKWQQARQAKFNIR